MISIRILRIPALVAALALCTTGAFAGAEPASPTAIVPPPPPPPPRTTTTATFTPAQVQASPTAIVPPPPPPPGTTTTATFTPAQVQAAQTLVQSFVNDPPSSLPFTLKTRMISVLRAILAAPEVLAQIGYTPAQIQALIAQVEAVPSVD